MSRSATALIFAIVHHRPAAGFATLMMLYATQIVQRPIAVSLSLCKNHRKIAWAMVEACGSHRQTVNYSWRRQPINSERDVMHSILLVNTWDKLREPSASDSIRYVTPLFGTKKCPDLYKPKWTWAMFRV